MLDGRGDEMPPGFHSCKRRPFDGGVVALRPAGGEHDLRGCRAETLRYRIAGSVQRSARFLSWPVDARWIREILREKRLHRLPDSRMKRGRRGVVQIDQIGH